VFIFVFMKKERFNTITDGVFAIIITIMILGIKIPEFNSQNIPSILQSVFIYLVSFVLVAILWINHHHILNHKGTISIGIVWLNFLLLFASSFIPVAAQMLDKDFYDVGAHVFYGITLGTASFMYALIYHINLKETKLSSRDFSNIINWSSTALFFACIPLSYCSVYISSAIFVLIPTFYFYHTFNPFKLDSEELLQ